MKKAFVTGWPINHSKSPLLHGFWLKQYEIAGSYEALAVEPENFLDFLTNLKKQDFAGGNITLPHKEIAFEHITHLDEAAKQIGAVNTLWFENGELHGGNTDAYGFAANMNAHEPQWSEGKTATVLGAGGASRAIIYAILQEGFDRVYIVNRTLERAQKLAEQFGDKCKVLNWSSVNDVLEDVDFIVNTTSLGMSGHDGGEANKSLVDFTKIKKTAIVTDIVYTPLQTPFLLAAEKCDLRTVDGLGMLLHQAVPGFEKWFGIRPEVTQELRDEILKASS